MSPIVDHGDSSKEIRNHRTVVGLEWPVPYDACANGGQHQATRRPDPDLVQPATASLGDICESGHGWEAVTESIAKAKREKVR